MLPLRLGGLGLRAAKAGRCAAYWASWAHTLPTLQARVPELVAAAYPLAGNDGVPATSSVAKLLQAAARLPRHRAGTCSSLAGNRRGSLTSATMVISCDKSACASLYSHLDPASRALMLSQAGPGGSLAITVLPTAPELRLPSSHMRVLLLRRLRQPLPVAPRTCRCAFGCAGRPPSSLPHSRSAGRSGRAARMGSGARLPRSWRKGGQKCDDSGHEPRCACHGRAPHRGASKWPAALAGGTSRPLTRDGAAHPGADRTAGSAVAAAANRKRGETYPELAVARRWKLAVVGIEVGWRFGAEAAAFLRKLAVARARKMPARLRAATRQASLHQWVGMLATGGWACWPPTGPLFAGTAAGKGRCSQRRRATFGRAFGGHAWHPSRLPAPTGERS